MWKAFLDRHGTSGIVLTAELFLICLACRIARIVSPAAVLPQADLPALALLSLIALAAEFYRTKEVFRPSLPGVLHAGLVFTLLPLCARLQLPLPLWQMFPVSMAAFGVTALLYSLVERRMLTAPHSPAAPAMNAFVLFLAAQCLHGLI